MKELFRIAPFREVQRPSFISILKDEPFAPLHGFTVCVAFHVDLPFLQSSFPTPALTPAERGGRSLIRQTKNSSPHHAATACRPHRHCWAVGPMIRRLPSVVALH